MSKIELLFGRTRLAFVVVVTTLVRQDDSLIIICMVLERETPTAHAAGSDGEAQGPRERGGKTVRRLSVRVEDASELALGNRFSWKGKPPGDVNNGVNPRPAAPSAFPLQLTATARCPLSPYVFPPRCDILPTLSPPHHPIMSTIVTPLSRSRPTASDSFGRKFVSHPTRPHTLQHLHTTPRI
jgi:hypothetical protein